MGVIYKTQDTNLQLHYSTKSIGCSCSSGMKRLACRKMARIVPASSSLCLGKVSVCFFSLAVMRRCLTWEPRWVWSVKPKREKTETMSLPDNLFGLGIQRFQLHRQQEGWIRVKSKFLKVLSFKVKGNCFLKICDRFIQRLALSDNVNFKTFGDVVFSTLPDKRFDRFL